MAKLCTARACKDADVERCTFEHRPPAKLCTARALLGLQQGYLDCNFGDAAYRPPNKADGVVVPGPPPQSLVILIKL